MSQLGTFDIANEHRHLFEENYESIKPKQTIEQKNFALTTFVLGFFEFYSGKDLSM